ncbi:MAG TPA: DUF2723 domain-containing protein [Candidatus Cloacimonadota bacterium]|nr:DUF2723 domain-containing protein [Candidatus Cloacimonadota bacterium]HPS37786.1 DUF2723 domain-containing protein [Candidatus Cloacimonadota bacterium]
MNAKSKPVTLSTKKKNYVVPEKPIIVDDQPLKPHALVPIRTNTLIAWAIFAVTLIVYMLTQARTMSFWDSGEYATCISILGVPHPPGNPFYIVFGRALVSLFGWLASDAVIAAFISCMTSAFAVMFTYLITVKLTSMFKIKAWEAMFAGVIAALFTAFSFTFWMNAIEAEVYSGLVFFVNLIFWVTLVWVEKSDDFDHQNILLLIVYLFFLGFCVHQTALQIAPAMLFIVVYPMLQTGVKKDNFWLKILGYSALLIAGYAIFGVIGKGANNDQLDKWGFGIIALLIMYIELRDVIDYRVWLLAFALVGIGLSSHFYLMVRAADRPFINEGQPSTLSAFTDYVLRRQYGQSSFLERRSSFFGNQLGFHFLRYFGTQWFNAETISGFLKIPANAIITLGAMIVGALGVVGGWFQLKQNRHSFRYLMIVLFFTTIAMVFIMNLSDGEVRDRDYFFVVAYNMWAILLGIGSLAFVHLIKSNAGKIAMICVLGLLPLLNLVSQYNVHDRSQEYIALDYGVNFLNSLEENAIIFTNGDNDTFPLWYAQAVQDPHAKQNIYKATDIVPDAATDQAIKRAMEYKNKYLKGIRKDVSIANLSLLNTPWYIRQLRDKEGILFNVDDSQLEDMNISFGRQFEVGFPGNPSAGKITVPIEDQPSWRPNGGLIRSDVAVMQIIKDNFGKRPIYFAVTCQSYIGFEEFTRNEGMVARVVTTKNAEQINFSRLLNNIDNIYQYRSIGNKAVYKDSNMRSLVQNYGSGFIKAAIRFVEIGDFAKAKSYSERGRKFIDNEIKMTEFNVAYYSATGQWSKLDEFIQKYLLPYDRSNEIYVSYVLRHLVEKYPDKTLEYVEKGMLFFPDDQSFAQIALEMNESPEAKARIKAIYERVKPNVNYMIDPYIQELDNPVPADTTRRN